MNVVGWSRVGAKLRQRGSGWMATLGLGVVLFASEARAQEAPATADAAAAAPSSSAEQGPLPAPPPPPAALPAAPAQPLLQKAAAPGPTIEIRLEANHEDAGLYRIGRAEQGIDSNLNGRLGGSRQRLKLCAAPCRLRVSPGDFVVAGPRLRESPTFSIAGRNKLVHVDADVGTDGAALGGIVLAGVGGFTLLITLPVVLVGAALEANGRDGTGLMIGGGAATAVGAGLLIGGVSMIVGSKTTVSLRSEALRAGH